MSGRGRGLARLLVLCGPLAAAFFALADVAGILMTPGYSARSQAISELMERGAPAKATVDALLLVYHGLVVPFALGLHRAVGGGGRLAPLLLGGAGAAGVALTLFFPCDPGCAPFVSVAGTLHIFIAVPMGFAILGAIWLFGARMGRAEGWGAFAAYSRGTAVAGLVLAAATVAMAESGVVGLLERLLTWSYLQWYAAVGVVAAARAGR